MRRLKTMKSGRFSWQTSLADRSLDAGLIDARTFRTAFRCNSLFIGHADRLLNGTADASSNKWRQSIRQASRIIKDGTLPPAAFHRSALCQAVSFADVLLHLGTEQTQRWLNSWAVTRFGSGLDCRGGQGGLDRPGQLGAGGHPRRNFWNKWLRRHIQKRADRNAR